LHIDHGAGIEPTIVVRHQGTEQRVKAGSHPFGSGW
jgi:hypothetical protein